MVKVMGGEFDLQLRYYISFSDKYLCEKYEPFYIPSYGLNSIPIVLLYIYKEGRESVRDDERCGRSKEVRTPELIGKMVRVRVRLLGRGFKGVQE